MSLKTASPGGRWQKNQWVLSVLTLLLALLLLPQPGNTKEENNNSRLPAAPDTGAPEEDFSAGGTRDNRLRNSACGVAQQQIAYLLGNRNREFTSSAYPTFWFHIPRRMNNITQMKFAVTELETGNKIYERVIGKTTKAGVIGIDLPQENQYALSPKVNYAWSLKVDCAQTDRESEITLEGWITRLPLPAKSQLQNQLAAATEAEKYQVYLQHNLLYDALTQLAQHRIAKPNNIQTETAWNHLLGKLGWQDLIEQKSKICPSFIDMQISTNHN